MLAILIQHTVVSDNDIVIQSTKRFSIIPSHVLPINKKGKVFITHALLLQLNFLYLVLSVFHSRRVLSPINNLPFGMFLLT